MSDFFYRILSDNSLWSVAEARFVAKAPPGAAVTELADLAELQKCLRFYGFELGDLAGPEDRAAEIKAELDALDAEYLTPCVLAGLATGDDYARARLASHEERAAPLRHELKRLNTSAR